MKLAIISITNGGRKLSNKLVSCLQADVIKKKQAGISETVKEIWHHYDAFIFIMASGIVVRSIAPLLQNKHTDPCVVVLDESGRYAISLLSGHLGGGNLLANQVAEITGGQAVVTTASDTLNLTPVDLWARHHNLYLTRGNLTAASATLVNTKCLHIYVENFQGKLPKEFKKVLKPEDADLIITNRITEKNLTAAVLRPKNLVVGVGCNRGTSFESINEAIICACRQNGFSPSSLFCLASITIKEDEDGLLKAAKDLNLEIQFFNAETINSVKHCSQSQTVFNATGAYAVAEPTALLAAKSKKLLVRKQKWKDVTTAIAEKTITLSANYQ